MNINIDELKNNFLDKNNVPSWVTILAKSVNSRNLNITDWNSLSVDFRRLASDVNTLIAFVDLFKEYAIQTGDIEDKAITTDKIEDGSVTEAKLAKAYSDVIQSWIATLKSITDTWSFDTENASISDAVSSALAAHSIALGTGTLAGAKAFTVLDINATSRTYKLDSVEGLNAGDVYSVYLRANDGTSEQAENVGVITAIDSSNNTVTVDVFKDVPEGTKFTSFDNYEDENGIDEELNTFRIISKPTVGTRIIGDLSSAEGMDTQALSKGAKASGRLSVAYGSWSTAEGFGNSAGYCSHAEGKTNVASGQFSHAEGTNGVASANAAHVEGYGGKASAPRAHAEGNLCTASGYASHAEGGGAIASGKWAHAEGGASNINRVPVASGEASHAEGYETLASGLRAHAEGSGSKATGDASHAEGSGCKADGVGSHAEGVNCEALQKGAHAQGMDCRAEQTQSFASGKSCIANQWCQHAVGKYNKADTVEQKNTIFMVGAGTSATDRKNAFEVISDSSGFKIKIGTTTLSEAQLQKLLKLI